MRARLFGGGSLAGSADCRIRIRIGNRIRGRRRRVPHGREQPELWDTSQVIAVEFHCSVMHQILCECCTDQISAAELAVYGGEPRKDLWTNLDGEVEEFTVVTVLAPEAVAAAAEVLNCAGSEAWMLAHPQRITAMVRELGFSTPWDEEWGRWVIGDLQRLADFYRAAASAGDAMVKYLSC